MCVSGSGGCSTTIPFVVAIIHPPGAVNVAPPDVVRGESTDTCSAGAAAGPGCWLNAEEAQTSRTRRRTLRIAITSGNRRDDTPAGSVFYRLIVPFAVT